MDPFARRAPLTAPAAPDTLALPGLGDIAEAALRQGGAAEPEAIPNPTNFRRLFFTPKGMLYRWPHNADPRNDFEVVTDPMDAATIARHGHYPLVVDPRVDVERMEPADLWPYLEYLRVRQYEDAEPDESDPGLRALLDLLDPAEEDR